MDLNFNQGGMPPTPSDNSTPPTPPLPPVENTVATPEVTNFPVEPSVPSEQPLAKSIDNIDAYSPQPVEQMPPPPPIPPLPTGSDIPATEEQYIQTPEDQPHKSLLWPILIVVILILLIAGAIGGWAFYSQKQNNKTATTNNIDLDSSTGQPVNTSPTTDTNNSANTTATNDLATIAGRDSQRKDDLKMIGLFLEAYKTKNGAYPISPSISKLNEPNTVVSALVPTYAPSLPTDPSNASSYYGYTSVDGTSYKITASLEDLSDPSGIQTGNYNIYTVTNLSTDTSANTDLTSPSVTTNPQSDSINSDFSSSDSSTN